MEVKFIIRPTTKLEGGLIFQLVYAKRVGLRSWSELNEDDFQASVGINDKAFNLIFANFTIIKTRSVLMIGGGRMLTI